MIEITEGDILHADTDALVNTVNCVGYMGRGIALQFKRSFPENNKAYISACKRDEVQPGKMFVFETGLLHGPKYIINFPTKRHWRSKSKLADIDSGLIALIDEIKKLGIDSIAIPPLGCGLGGLNWNDVRPRIESALAAVPDIRAVVFEPSGTPEAAKMARSTRVPKMTAGRAALVVLMERYLGGLMDISISLLEVHKLMYFLQEAGQPTKLRFVKAPYGPYAENLRHVLAVIEGHLISGYADGGDAPEKQLELVPGAVSDAKDYLDAHRATLARFDRVAELVDGFETPFGLELLATVHWLAAHENVRDPDTAVQAAYAWNQRKLQFSARQIRLAWDVLSAKGWLTATA